MKKYLIPLVCVICYSCSKSNQTQESSNCNPNISYNQTVKPILVTNCVKSNCHDGQTYPSLADYNVAHDGASQIRNDVATGRMPKDGTLSSYDKAAILCWIDKGAKNN